MNSRLVQRLLQATVGLLAVALVVLVAMIVPSPDNGPYMTPFALLVVALITALVLLGFSGGLRQREAEETGSQE